MKNNKLYLIVLFLVLFFTASAVIFMQMLKKTENELISVKYAKSATNLQDRIHDMIVTKQKSTLASALTIAYTDKNLLQFITNKKVPQNYFDALLHKYSRYTFYKNIWIQVIDKRGVCIYRSWSKYHGDNLSLVRKDVADLLQSPKIKLFISVGKFDMSIKATVPIFKDKTFMGMIVVVSHFNSISRQLSKNGIESVVVADKRFRDQLKFPVTHLFIDDFYVANKDAKPKLLEYLKKHDVEKYLGSGYKIENGYFIVTYRLENNGEYIGTYITFQKLDDFSFKSIHDFVLQWVLFGIISLMAVIGLINIILYYIVRKQKKYYQNIVDSSTNIVLVNEPNQIIEVNSRFFETFNKYKTLDEFKAEHTCICEFFVEEEGYIQKEMDGVDWVTYVKMNPQKIHKAKIVFNERTYYFLVSASVISEKPLRNAVVLSDITAEEIYKEELEILSITDPLTGMKNRRYYELSADKEASRACRYKEPLSIIFFDIDHFKKVNDEHGHDVGDQVLIEYSKLVKSMLRGTDELYRIGGEEFIVITPHTSQMDAYMLAEKIRKAIEEHHKVLPITVSMGVAQYKDCEKKDELFKRADDALYEAKESGRNRVVLG